MMTTMAEPEVKIDVQRVYDRLSGKIARLEVENAQLLEVAESLTKRVAELENPPSPDRKEPK